MLGGASQGGRLGIQRVGGPSADLLRNLTRAVGPTSATVRPKTCASRLVCANRHTTTPLLDAATRRWAIRSPLPGGVVGSQGSLAPGGRPGGPSEHARFLRHEWRPRRHGVLRMTGVVGSG